MSLFLGNRGTKLYKLEDENMVRKLQGNKERTLFKDPEPLFKDPERTLFKDPECWSGRSLGVSNSRPPASQPGAQPSEQPVRG